jgi:hypothetical protein
VSVSLSGLAYALPLLLLLLSLSPSQWLLALL